MSPQPGHFVTTRATPSAWTPFRRSFSPLELVSVTVPRYAAASSPGFHPLVSGLSARSSRGMIVHRSVLHGDVRPFWSCASTLKHHSCPTLPLIFSETEVVPCHAFGRRYGPKSPDGFARRY